MLLNNGKYCMILYFNIYLFLFVFNTLYINFLNKIYKNKIIKYQYNKV